MSSRIYLACAWLLVGLGILSGALSVWVFITDYPRLSDQGLAIWCFVLITTGRVIMLENSVHNLSTSLTAKGDELDQAIDNVNQAASRIEKGKS